MSRAGAMAHGTHTRIELDSTETGRQSHIRRVWRPIVFARVSAMDGTEFAEIGS